MGHSPCELFVHNLYIDEVYRPGAIFLSVGLSEGLSYSIIVHNDELRKEAISVNRCVMVVQKSSKLVPIDRKPICHFLLVFHCNYMPIFYRFRDITLIYWSKIYVFRFFIYPSLVWSPRSGCSPETQGMKFVLKTRVIRLPNGKNRMILQYSAFICV